MGSSRRRDNALLVTTIGLMCLLISVWFIRRLKDTDEERIGEAVTSYINFPQAMDIVVDRDQTFQTPIARRVNDLNSIGELDAKEEADSKSEEK